MTNRRSTFPDKRKKRLVWFFMVRASLLFVVACGPKLESVQDDLDGTSDSTKASSGSDSHSEELSTGSDTETETETVLVFTDPPDTTPFISTWQTNESGVSAANEVLLPPVSTGTYNFIVDWGDGTSDIIRNWDNPA